MLINYLGEVLVEYNNNAVVSWGALPSRLCPCIIECTSIFIPAVPNTIQTLLTCKPSGHKA